MVGTGKVLETILELLECLPSEMLRLVQLQVRTSFCKLLAKSLEFADLVLHLGILICLDLAMFQLVNVLAYELCTNVDLPEHGGKIIVRISTVIAPKHRS